MKEKKGGNTVANMNEGRRRIRAGKCDNLFGGEMCSGIPRPSGHPRTARSPIHQQAQVTEVKLPY